MRKLFFTILLLASISCRLSERDDGIVQKTKFDNYGFTISGDFNGDGIIDTLTEHYISTIDNKITEKLKHKDWDYDSILIATVKKKPMAVVRSSDSTISELTFDGGKTGQLFGLSHLKALGDIDSNGTDEVGVVVDWADYSKINYYLIYSYIDSCWVRLADFEIRDIVLEEDSSGSSINRAFENNFEVMDARHIRVKTYEMGEMVEKIVPLNNAREN